MRFDSVSRDHESIELFAINSSMTVQLKICPKCGASHEKSGTFCSRKCANSRTWTDEDKKKKSEAFHSSEKRHKNISRVKHPEFCDRKCEYCSGPIPWKGGKRYCSKECYLKFHEMSRTAFHNYKSKCSFKFNVYEFPDEFDLASIDEFGWYSASNKGCNLDGVSRDHRISIKNGFEQQIDPSIISHPANCELMRHSENQQKRSKSSIMLEELIVMIDRWNEKYQ